MELLCESGAQVHANGMDSTQPIHFAAQNGHTAVVKALLKRGARVNSRGTKRNDTPLHLAAFKDHCETVEYLLKKSADVTIRNKVGKLAVDVAASEECRAMLAAKAKTVPPRAGAMVCADDGDGEVEAADGSCDASSGSSSNKRPAASAPLAAGEDVDASSTMAARVGAKKAKHVDAE